MNRHRYRLIGNRYRFRRREDTTRRSRKNLKGDSADAPSFYDHNARRRESVSCSTINKTIPSPLQNANAKYTRTDSRCTVRTATRLRMCTRVRVKVGKRARRGKSCENRRRTNFLRDDFRGFPSRRIGLSNRLWAI